MVFDDIILFIAFAGLNSFDQELISYDIIAARLVLLVVVLVGATIFKYNLRLCHFKSDWGEI